MFILPSGVIARIEAICRNFLWDGGTDYMRTPLVGWSKICKPKSEGGLDLKDDLVWNKAALGKLLWWIYAKADHLLVKWVSHTYLKAQDWKCYVPTEDTSCFLAWIYFHKGLNTNEKLKSFGLDIDTTCLICGDGTETLEHLFFTCNYSQRIISEVEQWMGFILPRDDMNDWRMDIPGSQDKKDTINGIINAMMYSIWHQRNRSKHEDNIIRSELVAIGIIKDMKTWIAKIVIRKKKLKDQWIHSLCGA
ncbi:uncharacterized protein LOC141588452 [Silene latifolia]|uniref:uncharacterized protein LOC141588452 n=1 Tax=Silene latifolia TaxID=37657 RepID=UPI003D76B0B2